MKIDLYSQLGEKNGTIELPKAIFEAPFNKDLIHQALIRQLSNKRIDKAHTKTKGEVSGGGRKPYAQKGTGNARQGSIRSPQMKGGGIVFGPRSARNYHKMMPKKQRRLALFSALSEKARNNEIIALEDYQAKTPKTKDLATLLKKLSITRDVLIVTPEKNQTVQKSSNNLPYAKTITVNFINIQDLQRYKTLLLFKAAIGRIEEIFLKSSSTSENVPSKKPTSKTKAKVVA